jgi:transposase
MKVLGVRNATCRKCGNVASELSSRPGYYGCWNCGYQWRIPKSKSTKQILAEFARGVPKAVKRGEG